MATHRSLNKLEFKAHMSIHNLIDAENNLQSNFTRDRFGKKHSLENVDSVAQVRKFHPAVMPILSLLLLMTAQTTVFAETAVTKEVRKGPNCSVSSDEVSHDKPSEWMNRDDRFGVPIDSATTLGFNEDGDPSLSTRF